MRPYGKSEQLAKRRKRALKLLESGKPVYEVARIIGVTERSVRYWQKKATGFSDKTRVRLPDRPGQLSEEQLKQLEQELLRGAYQHGYAEDYWTLDRIARLIWDQFQIRYQPASVWFLMRQIGWSNQPTQQEPREGDDESKDGWTGYAWSRNNKSA
jgi:transposase